MLPYLQSTAFLRCFHLQERLVLTSQINYSEVKLMSGFSIDTLNVNAVIMVCRSSRSLMLTWPVYIFYTAFATKRM